MAGGDKLCSESSKAVAALLGKWDSLCRLCGEDSRGLAIEETSNGESNFR